MKDSQVSFEAWFESFRPIQNPLNVYADPATIDAFMFKSAGPDVEVVKSILRSRPGAVWSVLKNNDAIELQSGFSTERISFYMITQAPLEGDALITVVDESVEFEHQRLIPIH